MNIQETVQAVQGTGIYALTNGRTHGRPFDHRVCIAVCTCTPRLSSTLYSLLGLYLSAFLVVILTHPRLCTVTVVAPYRAVYFRCGLEACGVCLWRGHVCVPMHVPGSSDALTCGAIQAGPGHAHVPSLSDALTCGAIQAGPGHAHVLARVMHAHVGRFIDKQALAMQVSQAPVTHSRVWGAIEAGPGYAHGCARP